MRHLFVRLPVAALLALGALLSGCGGDDEPAGDPTPIIASPTESSEPTESESAVAAETPEEFVARLIVAYNKMQTSGDTKHYLAMSRNCNTCEDVAAAVREVYDRGSTVATGGWRIESSQLVREAGRSADVRIKVFSARVVERKQDGTESVLFKPGRSQFLVTLVRQRGAWLVRQIGQFAG